MIRFIFPKRFLQKLCHIPKEYTLKLVEEDRYKIFEPRKLATPKNICRELSKKVKKLEEELNKPAVEQPVQTEETQPVETPTNTVDDINEANKKLNAAINKIKELLSDKDIDILQ